MIKLIVSDMDGTFLNNKGDYNRALFQDVLSLMDKKGVKFAPCTGKQCERVEALFGEHAKNLLILGDSATSIKYQGEYLYQSLLSNETGLKIIERLESLDKDHIVIACTQDGTFIKNSNPLHLQQRVKKSYMNVTTISCYSEIKCDFVKITVFNAQGSSLETKPHLADFFDQAYIVVSEENWMDIANHGVHKGSTVEKLQELLGVTHAETMVFGDGWNDLELMEKGAFSFAMRNGYEETKAAANYIAGHHNDDSVMKTIIQFLNIQA